MTPRLRSNAGNADGRLGLLNGEVVAKHLVLVRSSALEAHHGLGSSGAICTVARKPVRLALSLLRGQEARRTYSDTSAPRKDQAVVCRYGVFSPSWLRQARGAGRQFSEHGELWDLVGRAHQAALRCARPTGAQPMQFGEVAWFGAPVFFSHELGGTVAPLAHPLFSSSRSYEVSPATLLL